MTPHEVALELALDPDAAARLPRVPALAQLRAGRTRTSAVEMVWHDTPEAALAEAGVSLCERRAGRETVWRLERLRGTVACPWPPGAPAPLVAEAARPEALGHDLPERRVPVAAFSGDIRSVPLAAGEGALTLALLHGTVRAVAGEQPVCRVLIGGAATRVEALAQALAAVLPLRVPEAALAAEACAIAGRPVPPRALGAPDLPAAASVGDTFARVVGHLGAVLLHWAPLAAHGDMPEAVHQMRVALRRLRSALSLFRAATAGPELDALSAELRQFGRVLGPPRDWDVFAGGIGREVGASFPHDRAVQRLLAAAERQRQQGYAALRDYLGGPAFRQLGLRLACLAVIRPWEHLPAADGDEAAAKQAALRDAPLGDFADRALGRRLDRVLEPGADLSELPVEALHALRIQCKRMRYAAEFFAPLYPRKETRRFLRRISALQERLGHLNDGAVADGLMAQLGGGGPERAMAVGIVRGYVAAGMRRARAKSERCWLKFRRLDPFWA